VIPRCNIKNEVDSVPLIIHSLPTVSEDVHNFCLENLIGEEKCFQLEEAIREKVAAESFVNETSADDVGGDAGGISSPYSIHTVSMSLREHVAFGSMLPEGQGGEKDIITIAYATAITTATTKLPWLVRRSDILTMVTTLCVVAGLALMLGPSDDVLAATISTCNQLNLTRDSCLDVADGLMEVGLIYNEWFYGAQSVTAAVVLHPVIVSTAG